MYGSDMGVLNVIVNGKVLISLSGDQGNKWIKKMKTISGVTGKKVVNTFFFLLCTFSGADRVPQLRKIGYLFILEILAGTLTVRPLLVHPPVLSHHWETNLKFHTF